MNKFFKLIYVNILGLFDLNKIIIAKEDGVKSNLEKKSVITGLIVLIYGYLLYKLFMLIKLSNPIYNLVIAFIISSLLCFFMNINIIGSIVFKSEDNDILFSMPVTLPQILFSKLFTAYLKNLLFTIVLMFSAILSIVRYETLIDDTFVIMFVISTLTIPLIPIVLASLFSYINDYFKVKTNNSMKYKIIKIIIVLICLGIIFIVFKDISTQNVDVLVEAIVNKFYYLYPLTYLVYLMFEHLSIWAFLGLVIFPILIIYIYTMFISNNYLKICSLLKGINTNSEFKYKNVIRLNKTFGLIRKEMINLFNNKFYLFKSYGSILAFSILLFIGLRILNIEQFYKIDNFKFYLNLYVPTLLALFASMSGSAISAMSLEKDNMQMLRTMPISIGKIVLSKWLTNVFIGTIFILINGIIVWYYLDLSKWSIFYSFLIPFVSLLFVSLTSVLLDYRFIEKNETNDNAIISQRFIIMVPMFISVVIGVGVFFIPPYKQYELLLGSYALAMVVLMVIEYLYMKINKNKLIQNLFN